MRKVRENQLKTINSWIEDNSNLEDLWNVAFLIFKEKGFKAAFDYVENENLKYQTVMERQGEMIEGKPVKYSLDGTWSMKRHLEYLEGLEFDKELLEQVKNSAAAIPKEFDKKMFLHLAKTETDYLLQLRSTTIKQWRVQIDEILNGLKDVEKLDKKPMPQKADTKAIEKMPISIPSEKKTIPIPVQGVNLEWNGTQKSLCYLFRKLVLTHTKDGEPFIESPYTDVAAHLKRNYYSTFKNASIKTITRILEDDRPPKLKDKQKMDSISDDLENENAKIE